MQTARRSVLIAMLIVFAAIFSLPAAAQIEPRVPPANDSLAVPKAVFVPFSQILNTSEATTESGEQLQICTASDVSKSVWYFVSLPVGLTLVVDTTGSNYDTVVTVWKAPAAVTAAGLTSVDCEDDGTDAAVLRYKVAAAGAYYISISKVESGPRIILESLTVAFGADVPATLRPAGSDPAHAIPLKLNAKNTASKLEYGMNNSPVVGAPTCAATATQYPAWFKLHVQIRMNIRLNAEGSLFTQFGGLDANPAIDVYPADFDDAADAVGCDNDSGLDTAANLQLDLDPGDYFIRVIFGAKSTNAIGASRARISARLIVLYNALINGNFNNADHMLGWTLKNGSIDDAPVTPGFLDGTTAFRFTGAPGEASQLQQKFKFSPPLSVDDDHTIRLDFFSEGSVSGLPYTATLDVTYSDGTKQRLKRNLLSSGAQDTPRLEIVLKKKPISSVKATFKFTGTSGTLAFDGVRISVSSLIARSGEGVLPLPLPPAS